MVFPGGMVSLGGMASQEKMGNKDLLAPLDLLGPLAPRVGGPSTPDGGRAPVHRRQALRWCTLASLGGPNGTSKEVELTISACPKSQNTAMTFNTELKEIIHTPVSTVQSIDKDFQTTQVVLMYHVPCATCPPDLLFSWSQPRPAALQTGPGSIMATSWQRGSITTAVCLSVWMQTKSLYRVAYLVVPTMDAYFLLKLSACLSFPALTTMTTRNLIVLCVLSDQLSFLLLLAIAIVLCMCFESTDFRNLMCLWLLCCSSC